MMNMIFKKVIARRTFLRGLGTTLAFPLLDGMASAFAAKDDPANRAVTRLAFVYVPNGIIMKKWTPTAEGADFELAPLQEPLAPFRDSLRVLSGLDSKEAWGLPGEMAGEHSRAAAAFLTGAHAKPYATGATSRGVSEPTASTSVDQVAAKEFGKQTQLASLELGIESPEVAGACDAAYACSYFNTICWRTPTEPLPMENHPRAVFERLFGDSESTDPAKRLERIRENRSILDMLREETARFLKKLGPADRDKVNQYLEAVRDVERRIQMAEEQSSRQLPMLRRPIGIPATVGEHMKLLFDLQVLAYQSDLTRVGTMMVGHEMSSQPYPELGISDPYHPLTHHQGDPEKIAKATEVNLFHVKQLAYFLEKLRSTNEGDGSLLDHSIVVHGAGLSDGNQHLPTNLPILLAGGGSGRIKGRRHLRYPKGTPIANLWLAVLDLVNIPIERFADSTEKLNLGLEA